MSVCRLCGSSDLSSVLRLKPSPLGDQYLAPGLGAKEANLVPFGINHCGLCGNFQTEAAIEREHYQHCLTRPAAVNKTLSNAYRDSVANLISLTRLKVNHLVLEIGSNDGLVTSFFADLGYRCLGVDPAKNLADSAMKLGVPTVVDFFTEKLSQEIVQQHGKAKVVIANFVVANVDDLDDFMAGVSVCLDTDGVFVMETNDVLSILSKQLVETLVHEHLTYFSVTALSKFLERHHLEIFDVAKVGSKGGSLRCFIQHSGSKNLRSTTVDEFISFESSCDLLSDSTWEQFERTFAFAGDQALQFCEQNHSDGIVGYGTSDGATTLIYQLGIGGYLKALIDDDPYRQNLESPGFGIPTVSRDEIFTDPPAARNCLILAPQYVKQIVDKNSAARGLGVVFAKVWPSIEIIRNSQ